jgi:hypothetical protein
MTAVLGNYDASYYALEGLQILKNALGMANRVHRGFDAERRTYNKGSVIKITRPGTFTAAAAPATAVDLQGESVDLTLDQDYEVKFKILDKNFVYTGPKFVQDHIGPAMYALADKIDTTLCALYKDVPNYYDVAGGASSTAVVADITNLKKVMFNAKVPWNDTSKLNLMIDGSAQGALEAIQAFSQYQGAGDDAMRTLRSGGLGQKFGFNIFANQNVPAHTKGTCADTALQGVGTQAAGVTTLDIDAVDAGVTGTLVAGDVLTITHTILGARNYCVTATSTASGNAYTDVAITPPLAEEILDNHVITARLDNHNALLGFHQNAFALAFGKLPDYAEFGSQNSNGVDSATVQDPDSGVALRIMFYQMPDLSELRCKVGALWGVKTLNPYLAARLCG